MLAITGSCFIMLSNVEQAHTIKYIKYFSDFFILLSLYSCKKKIAVKNMFGGELLEEQIEKLFERVTNTYSLMLLNWAYKKLGVKDKAEDLAQEVLVQVFTAIKKDISGGRAIEKLENMVWKIAHYVWCHYLRRDINYKMCIPIESLQLEDKSNFADTYADSEDERQLMARMRESITRLNYLQREIMISFYIDKLSVRQISDMHRISESNVKWHLYDSRKKLKKEIMKMSDTEYVYRPRKLHLALSGQAVLMPDTTVINQSLTKQNICIACYKQARTLDEMNQILGIPKAYIEDDLQWLVEREFIKENNGRYLTMFMIDTAEYEQGKYAVYLQHKEGLSDVIINELLAAEDNIRKIRFYGSDKPMSKLLWMLIYRFCNYSHIPYKTKDAPIRPDGGKYFPLGFDRSDADLIEKVVDTTDWAYNGAMRSSDFYWFGLYNFGKSEIENLMTKYTGEWFVLHQLLCKVISCEFDITNFDKNEKYELSKLVQRKFVTMDGRRALPNFCVFTSEQYQQLLDTVFAPIHKKISDELQSLVADFEQYCKENVPAQLKDDFSLFVDMALKDISYLTTIFAFNDSKLYVPRDNHDGEFLTFMYIKQ